MWPVLVEFRSSSSESIADEKKEEDRRIAVKPKSADDYVGWLNK